MTFFESLIALLLLAVVLLQVARRSPIPYPAMLAAAGVIVALIPGSPDIALDGRTALALFLAPVLLDSGFDFPLTAIRRLWKPLVALAIVAVLLTTAVVAWIGWAFAGLPLAAAVALGAIVAPPDTAAATTVLRSAHLPRRAVQILTGESLLNDASALLLYGVAIAIQSHGGIDTGVAVRLGLAVPGGIALGLACGWAMVRVMPFTRGSLGGNLLEFAGTYTSWILAEHLGMSSVLCVVTTAMVIAATPAIQSDARNRVQSFAVWGVAVFVLNVLAFLLMGMQARQIVLSMPPERLHYAMGFAALVVGGVIVTRLAWSLLYNRLVAHLRFLGGDTPPPDIRYSIVVGWCGMRGLVTLATAFALPANFPQRDLIVLSAFAVVLATLVIQGLTLGPLIRLLGLRDDSASAREHEAARRELLTSAFESIERENGQIANELRRQLEIERDALDGTCDDFDERQRLKIRHIDAQRDKLNALRDRDAIGDEEYLRLQEQIDWHDLAIGPGGRRTIEEG